MTRGSVYKIIEDLAHKIQKTPGVIKVDPISNVLVVECANGYGAHICTDSGMLGAIKGTYELVPLDDGAITWGVAGIDECQLNLSDERTVEFVNKIAQLEKREK